MKCFHCQSQLERRSVSYTANRKGYHLIIDNVPAWVCKQCGEPLFDEQSVIVIQAMLQDVDARLEKLAAAA